MAEILDEKDTMAELFQVVGFSIGNEEFAVDILNVQEIIKLSEITRVPKAPPIIKGVVNLRGKVLPVVELRKMFSFPEAKRTKDTRIIVINYDGKTIGLLVDSVSEVLRIPRSSIDPAPSIVGGVDSEYLSGVGKLENRLIIILNLEKVLEHGKH